MRLKAMAPAGIVFMTRFSRIELMNRHGKSREGIGRFIVFTLNSGNRSPPKLGYRQHGTVRPVFRGNLTGRHLLSRARLKLPALLRQDKGVSCPG